MREGLDQIIMALMTRATDVPHRLCTLYIYNRIRIVKRYSLHQVGIVSNHTYIAVWWINLSRLLIARHFTKDFFYVDQYITISLKCIDLLRLSLIVKKSKHGNPTIMWSWVWSYSRVLLLEIDSELISTQLHII